MCSRDGSVRVDSFCRTCNNGLQVLGKINRFEVGVKLLRSDITKVLGILGIVIPSDSPG